MERIARLTTKRREREELEGLGGERKQQRERESIRANGQECVKVCPVAPPPIQPLYPPFLRPHSVSLSVFVCVALSLSDSNQNLRKLFKSKAVIALQKFL